MKNKYGVSLIELIAVITMMGIITAIAIPTTITAIKRAERKACVASSEAVSRDYMNNTLFNIDPTITPEDALNDTLEDFNCKLIEGQTDIYSGICPTSNCRVTLDEHNDIVITCLEHGAVKEVLTADKLFGQIISTEEFNRYYDRGSSERGLDSTGINFGSPITEKIEDVLETDLSGYSWRIYKTRDTEIANDGTYQMYLTSIDITALSEGSPIQCMKYSFNDDGSTYKEPKPMTCYVKTKVMEGVTINYIAMNP